MAEQTSFTAGFFATLERLRSTVAAILQNRLQLARIELEEEKARALTLVICGAVVMLTGLMALITITFLVVVAFWDQAVWVLVGFSLFYLCSVASALLAIRNKFKTPPFAETINQIKKDGEWLFPRK